MDVRLLAVLVRSPMMVGRAVTVEMVAVPDCDGVICHRVRVTVVAPSSIIPNLVQEIDIEDWTQAFEPKGDEEDEEEDEEDEEDDGV